MTLYLFIYFCQGILRTTPSPVSEEDKKLTKMESELVNLTHMVANTNRNENELQRSILHQQQQSEQQQQQKDHQHSITEKLQTPKEGDKEEDLNTKVRNIIKTVMNAKTTPQSHTSALIKNLHPTTAADTVYPTPVPARQHTIKPPNLASALALDLGEMEEEQMSKTGIDDNDEDAENAFFKLSRKNSLREREIGQLERVPTTPILNLFPTTRRPKYTLQQLLLPGAATVDTDKTKEDTTQTNFNGNLEESYARLNDEDDDAAAQTTPVSPLNHHHHAMPAVAVSESHDQLEKEISLGKIAEAPQDGDENDSLFEPMDVTNRVRGSAKNDDEILDSISLKNMLEERKNYRPDSDPSSRNKYKTQVDPHDDIDDTLKAAKQFENIEFHPEFTSTNGKSRGPDEFAFSTAKPPQTTPLGGTTRAPETDREGPNMVDITEIKMHRHALKPTTTTTLLSQQDVSLDDFFNSTSGAMIQKKNSITKIMNSKKKKYDVPDTEQRGKDFRPIKHYHVAVV